MTTTQTTRQAPDPGLLTSLAAAVREVISADAPEDPEWRAWIEGAAGEVERFKRDCGPLIEQVAAVQERLRHDPRARKLAEAAAAVPSIGIDGRLSPEAVRIGVGMLQLPGVAELGASAAGSGVKGLGLLTANVEAAAVVGVQAGAELVWLWPYWIGTYRTPNQIVGRAWSLRTRGIDLGYSGTAVPFPFDISLWFVPPENSKHLVGGFFELVVGAGIRVEILGWVPEKPNDGPLAAAPGTPDLKVDPFKFIGAVRVVLEFGMHVGLGLALQGRQVVSTKTLGLSSYDISPSNIEASRPYDGSDPDHPLLTGVITAPERDEQPSRLFVSTGDQSTLQLTFPDWMCSAMSQAPQITFTNDGGGGSDGSAGWSLDSPPSLTDLTYQYTWTGTDRQAWQHDIRFTIAAHSGTTPPQSGRTLCHLTNLENVGIVDVPLAPSQCPMTLSAQVFTASGSCKLTADPAVNSIEGLDVSAITEPLTATNADNGQQSAVYYYIPNPKDPEQPLIINEISTGKTWYAGYQLQQADRNGTGYLQFRAAFWPADTRPSDRNSYYGTWQTMQDPSLDYTSVAVWSDGEQTDGTAMTITLRLVSS